MQLLKPFLILLFFLGILFLSCSTNAPSNKPINSSFSIEKSDAEEKLIAATLLDYIEGTANGEKERISKAFHPDLNLYAIAGDTLRVRNGQKYIEGFEEGKKYNRIGKIIDIDYENDAATAKVEIDMPHVKRIYTDYFLLLKYQGNWKIIHKSYTHRNYPKQEK